MSIQHIVWLKQKTTTPDEDMAELLAAINNLIHSIPDIEKITSGPNFTDRANGYTHGAIITLKDKQALQNYIQNPQHVAVAQQLVEKAEVLVMDYESL